MVRLWGAVTVVLGFVCVGAWLRVRMEWGDLFDLCSAFGNATSDGYVATVSFTKTAPHVFWGSVGEYFGYQTRAFDRMMVLRPGTGRVVSFDGRVLRVKLPLPFVANYSGHLFCVRPGNWRGSSFRVPHDVLASVDRAVELNFTIDEFDNATTLSQMQCYGTSFETRFCDMRNVAVFRQMIVFETAADYDFPRPFLCASARSAPFDREETRLVYEPVVVHSPVQAEEHVSELSYITGRFFNSQMLWHMLFDFLVPCFHTFSLIEGRSMNRARRVFLRDMAVTPFHPLLRSLSYEPVVNLFQDNVTRAFSRVIVGLAKLEVAPSAARNMEAMLSVRYNFQVDTAPMLRSEVFTGMGIREPALDVKHPLVLLIERKTEHRQLLNAGEIEQFVMSECPFCKVQRVDLSEMELGDQIELVARAVVLIGVHGSGLSHVLWMRKTNETTPTAVVELLPHGYSCRDWFKGAARVANVSYYKVMSARVGATHEKDVERTESLERCWDHPDLCDTLACHDLLRDQDVWINIEDFKAVWLELLRIIRSSMNL